jgi:hypothetical protein
MNEDHALQIVECQAQRVLTTAQLAVAYHATEQQITNNFNRNKDKYQEGKHYIRLVGREKSAFLSKTQIEFSPQSSKPIYLWTEKGALLHAKSLNTDCAWEAYDRLIDEYYRLVKSEPARPPEQQLPANALMHQRLRLFYARTRLRAGYWCVFGEVASYSYYYPALAHNALPDVSVGSYWKKYVDEHPDHFDPRLIETYDHWYPDQRRKVKAYQYPNAWLGEFRSWFQQVYLIERYPHYLRSRALLDPAAAASPRALPEAGEGPDPPSSISSTIHPALFAGPVSYEVQSEIPLNLGLDGPSKTPSERRPS